MAIRKSKKLNKIIEDKQKVDFTYLDRKGKVSKRKGVEIHTMGYDKKGHSAIRAWDETRGDWRLFHNSNIVDMKISGEYKKTKPGYRYGDRGMAQIVKQTKKNNKK